MTNEEKKLLVVDNNPDSAEELKQISTKNEYPFTFETCESSLHALDIIYSKPPDLIIVSQSLGDDECRNLYNRIKRDTIFNNLPIVLMLQPADHLSEIEWENTPVDDYLQKPFSPEDLWSRISLTFARAARNRDSNPLTLLPGNYSIMRELQLRIDGKVHFSVGYVDLDNFKSYNDKYGFLRGDEIIKITARLLTNSVHKLHTDGSFVGHIGGDDFVFIVPPGLLDAVCNEIINNFDLVIGNFYDEGDRTRGFIDSTNRKGQKERFPIMSLSIAVISNEYYSIKHIGQISAIAAEIKKRVKAIPGSNYAKDLRRLT
jgi:PleD family two-component response regulator